MASIISKPLTNTGVAEGKAGVTGVTEKVISVVIDVAQRETRSVKCQKCHKIGHFALVCQTKNAPGQENSHPSECERMGSMV